MDNSKLTSTKVLMLRHPTLDPLLYLLSEGAPIRTLNTLLMDDVRSIAHEIQPLIGGSRQRRENTNLGSSVASASE